MSSQDEMLHRYLSLPFFSVGYASPERAIQTSTSQKYW
jgi:hypothetical protein